MDIRTIPGSVSQATLLPALALREMQSFGQTAIQQLVKDFAVPSAVKAYATSSTVQAQSTPNMTVNVTPFDAYGGSPTLHGLGFNNNLLNQTGVVVSGDGITATATVTIATASPSNPRRDLICFQIQSLDMNYASNNTSTVSLKAVNPTTGAQSTPSVFLPNTIQRVALQYVQGTAAGSPTLPSVPAGWIALAEVYVATSATTITNSNITFALPFANRGYTFDRAIPFAENLFCYTVSSGLALQITAGNVRIGQTFYAIAAGSLTLTDATTNYVYVDNTGTLAFNTTGFPSDSVQLATVVTSGGNISTITDKRVWLTQPVTSSNTLPQKYQDGFFPTWVNGTSISFSAGKWLHTDGLTIITSGSPITVSNSAIGANGFAQSSGNMTGTVSTTSGANTLTGSGTSFTTQLVKGDVVLVNGEYQQIASVINDFSATTVANWAATNSGVTWKWGGPCKNTLYHAYLAWNGSTAIIVLTTRDRMGGQTLVNFPAGYTSTVYQMPVPWRISNAGQFWRQHISGWPKMPRVRWANSPYSFTATDNIVYNATTQTNPAAAAALFSCSAFMPSYAQMAHIRLNSTNSYATQISPADDTSIGIAAESIDTSGTGTGYMNFDCPTDPTQQMRVWSTVGNPVYVALMGYDVTKEVA